MDWQQNWVRVHVDYIFGIRHQVQVVLWIKTGQSSNCLVHWIEIYPTTQIAASSVKKVKSDRNCGNKLAIRTIILAECSSVVCFAFTISLHYMSLLHSAYFGEGNMAHLWIPCIQQIFLYEILLVNIKAARSKQIYFWSHRLITILNFFHWLGDYLTNSVFFI